MKKIDFLEKATKFTLIMVFSVAAFFLLEEILELTMPGAPVFWRTAVCSMASYTIGFFGSFVIDRIKLLIQSRCNS